MVGQLITIYILKKDVTNFSSIKCHTTHAAHIYNSKEEIDRALALIGSLN